MGCIIFEHGVWGCSLFPGFHFFIDSLVAMEKAMKRDNINVNDRQLACARINSPEGQDYLKGMAAAANYAWVNRSSMTFLCRQVHIGTMIKFNKTFSEIGKLWICLFLANKKIGFFWFCSRLLPRCLTAHQMTLTCLWFMMCRTTLQRWRNILLMGNRRRYWSTEKAPQGRSLPTTPWYLLITRWDRILWDYYFPCTWKKKGFKSMKIFNGISKFYIYCLRLSFQEIKWFFLEYCRCHSI